MAGDPCRFHFDDEQNGGLFDAASALAAVSPRAFVYTDGPGPLLRSVESATAAHPTVRVHFEWFTAPTTAASCDQPFTVMLRRSSVHYEAPARRSILEVLEAHGAGVP